MEMQKNLERIIAETSAVAIPVTAQPGEKEDWIRYSDSNEGEPGYYRDYLDPKTGAILYSFGETCCVHPWLCDPAGVLRLSPWSGSIDVRTVTKLLHSASCAVRSRFWLDCRCSHADAGPKTRELYVAVVS